jgi:hypothetical protein
LNGWLMALLLSRQTLRQAHGTGEKPLNYEDRLGAIATMDTQLQSRLLH